MRRTSASAPRGSSVALTFCCNKCFFETRELRVNCPSRVSRASVKNVGNKQKEAGIVLATGHPFPPPPVLGRSLGAADGPSGCALIFLRFTGASFLRNTPSRRSERDHPCVAFFARGRVTDLVSATKQARPSPCSGPNSQAGLTRIGETTLSAAARAGAPCGRRTALGSPRRRRPRAGTAWRSGTPAPDAGRSESARDKR